jgi:hypothetical protein
MTTPQGDTRVPTSERIPSVTLVGWVLCALSLLSAAVPALFALGAGADNALRATAFLKSGVTEFLLVAGLASLLALFAFAGWRRWSLGASQLRPCLWVAALGYPLALVWWLSSVTALTGCKWTAEYSIGSSDGEMYYVLHASPPLNGPGHSALARRTSASPVHFTVEILTDFEWAHECFHGGDALRAATRDPDARVRMISSELLRSSGKLHPLVADPSPASGEPG